VHPHVQIALDPEFAVIEQGQRRPGVPPGRVTAQQVNEVQYAMSRRLRQSGAEGRRFLVLHQFMDSMIRGKSAIAAVDPVDLVVTMDGYGAPATKVTKYNRFMTNDVPFAGFKLFYDWDSALLSVRQVLGIDRHASTSYVETTPNLIIYQ
jgi:hypothetical protein